MSPSEPGAQTRNSPATHPPSTGGVARVWIVVGLWLALCVWVGTGLHRDWAPAGQLDGLIPVEHRAPRTEILVIVAVDSERAVADSGRPAVTAVDLLAAADRIHDELGPAWVPIASPSAEIEGWLDSHALLLLPLTSHAELRDRLTDDAISASVDGLRARLSSPLFSLTGDEARRDPLRLRELSTGAAGQFSHVLTGTRAGATVTPHGDLLARSRDALLMELRPETPAAVDDLVRRVRALVADGLADGPLSVELVGAMRTQRDAAELLADEADRLVMIAFAATGLVLALALRRLRATLAILLTLGSGVGCVALIAPTVDPLSFPLLVLLIGFGCEGALYLQRISARGWPAALVLGFALLPLQLSPYPEWKTWSLWWIVAVAIVMALFRFVLPALVQLSRGQTSWDARGFLLRPMPALALVLTATALGIGVWGTQSVGYRGADRVELGDALHPAPQKRLADTFFDPALVAEARSVGPDAPTALLRSARDADALMAAVPRHIQRVDSPGTLVLSDAVLDQRRASLAHLDLEQRLGELSTILETQGFRPAAFGEFLRGAIDDDSAPTATALVEGPLGRWVRRYLVEHPDGAAVRTFVHLPPDPESPIPVVLDDDGKRLDLVGPAIAARTDRGEFRDWLGVYILCQLWIGSVIVWLGTRSFATSIAAAFAALVTQTSVVSVLLMLGQSVGPVIVPALLLVGAAAMIAAGRSCRAMDLQRPFFAMGVLTTSACQVAGGLALVASDVPAWSQVGMVVAIGAAVASGAGLFVAPGITRVLRAVSGVPVIVHQEGAKRPEARPDDEEDER